MIEIKFKEIGQKRWEDIPVFMECADFQLDYAISELRRLYTMQEIRYNHKRSYQGHYVSGNVALSDLYDAINTLEDYGHSAFYQGGKVLMIWASGQSEILSALETIRIAKEILENE